MLSVLGTRAARRTAAAVLFGSGVALSGVAGARADDAPKGEKKAAETKPGIDPKDVRVGPPPELAALRAAVEAAAKKGENVDEVRKQLDALETALAGRAWVKPKPVEEATPPQPGRFPNPVPRADAAAMQKAQELLLRAALMRGDDPAKAEELMRQARDLMARGLRPEFGGGFVVPVFPGDGLAPARGRLGVRVDRVPEALAEKNKVPAGRGVLAAEIVAGSVAEKVGLKADDVIVEFAGKPVADDPTEFVRTVQGTRAGEKVDIVFYRDGKKETIKGVTLGDPAANADLPLDPPVNVKKRSTQQVRVQNGGFTIKSENDGVAVRVEGKMDGGKAVPSKIEVTDGDTTVEAATVEKLPAQYQARVQKLLAVVRVGR